MTEIQWAGSLALVGLIGYASLVSTGDIATIPLGPADILSVRISFSIHYLGLSKPAFVLPNPH